MLKAENISFSYGDKKILEDFSIEVSGGERLVILAPSGFGKTTICKILSGYILPDEGRVLVDGENLPNKGTSPVQMIWQHPEIAVDPIQRMKGMLDEAGEVSEDILTRFEIEPEWLTRFPHELSGGELQRFCIVRALLANPKYLIADEISTMLDALTQAKIWRALLEEVRKRDIGIVIVTHSQALANKLATRIEELTTTKQIYTYHQ